MTSVPAVSNSQDHLRRRWPFTLWLGILIVATCEGLLFVDVHLSHRGPVRSAAERLAVSAPHSLLGEAARWMAGNMTAIVWVGYVILLEGILTFINGTSPARRRPHHFALLCLASVFVWGVFDMINFNLDMRAWIYIGIPGTPGIPGTFFDRVIGYLLAFGCVVPGMLLSGQVLMDLGAFNWARKRQWQSNSRMPGWILWLSLMVGLGMIAAVIFAPTPAVNYVLWTSLVFLLDPINYWLGRPSMFRDWERGWFGRTLAACAGGLICGFLWEFWNYWALTKWTYHLPFLGFTEQYKYFEMPLVGLLGFIPFGVECWVMWQMIRIPFDGLAEPLPEDRALL
jgi:hypothetical protein